MIVSFIKWSMEVSINVDIPLNNHFFPSKTIHYVDPPFMETPKWSHPASIGCLEASLAKTLRFSTTRVLRNGGFGLKRFQKRYTLVMGSSYITSILGKLLDMDLAGFHMKFGGCNFGWVPWRIHVILKLLKCPQPRFTQFVAFNRGQNLLQKKNTIHGPPTCHLQIRKNILPKKNGCHLWYTGRKCSLCFFWASPVNGCCIRMVIAGGTQPIPKPWFGNGILRDGARER